METRKRQRINKLEGRPTRRQRVRQESVDNIASLLLSLPPELQVEIFSYLNLKDLLNAGMICKELGEVAKDDFLWKTQLGLLFNQKPASLIQDKETYKQTFFRVVSEKNKHAFLVFNALNQSCYDPLTYFNYQLIERLRQSKSIIYSSIEQIEANYEIRSQRSPIYILEFTLTPEQVTEMRESQQYIEILEHAIMIHPHPTNTFYCNKPALPIKLENETFVAWHQLSRSYFG